MAMFAAVPSECDEERPPLSVRSGIHSPPEKEQIARLCLSEFCRLSKKLALYHVCRLKTSDFSGLSCWKVMIAASQFYFCFPARSAPLLCALSLIFLIHMTPILRSFMST
jgi:hypothetical protein